MDYTHVADLMSMCSRWKLILYETPDETVYLQREFEIQVLPEDYRDFLNLTTY